ncbi:MAG: hypothetical protein KDA38_10125, partial [Planctomycetales bacterium]|nr:hypothetical protein [Planctomycetales bacterium]
VRGANGNAGGQFANAPLTAELVAHIPASPSPRPQMPQSPAMRAGGKPKQGMNPLIWVAVGVGGMAAVLLIGVVLWWTLSSGDDSPAVAAQQPTTSSFGDNGQPVYSSPSTESNGPMASSFDNGASNIGAGGDSVPRSESVRGASITANPTDDSETTNPASTNGSSSNTSPTGASSTNASPYNDASAYPRVTSMKDAPVGWAVTFDPPKSPVSWPESVKLNIPTPPPSDRILYSATPSTIAAFGFNITGGQPEAWNLATQKRLGQLNDKIKDGNNVALSPDGRYLAVKGKEPSSMQLWSFATGNMEKEFLSDEATLHLQAFAFSRPDRLVTQTFGATGGKFRRVLRVWSIPDAKLLHEFDTQHSFTHAQMAISPGGRYLFGIHGANKLHVFDLDNGVIAGHLSLDDVIADRAGVFRGMTFSPDGRQLAFVFSDTNSTIAFLDPATGKQVDSIAMAGKPPTASAYAGKAVEWLGDRGWCLFGGTVIERKTRRVVWNLDLHISSRLTARASLNGGWIAQGGPYNQKRLRFVPIPWDQINASLAALEQSGAAHLSPGKSVSLNLQVGELRYGTEPDTRERLAEIFGKRFDGDKISVADGQPVELKVVYNEAAGETLQERQGFFGPATGRTVQSTNVSMQLALGLADGSQTFWTDTVVYNPRSVTVRAEEANEATVRDAIFQQLLFTLSETPIPYFVPQAANQTMLPGTTRIGYDK